MHAVVVSRFPVYREALARLVGSTFAPDAAEGFAASPCQGDGAACTDVFSWHGTVSLQAVSG